MFYQAYDTRRLAELEDIKQQTKNIVQTQHDNLTKHHEEAENLLETHINDLSLKINQVEQQLTDFKDGKEYQRLRELPDILEKKLGLQKQKFKQQFKHRERPVNHLIVIRWLPVIWKQ